MLPEPLLVIAPHPDDEVIGCGAVLMQALVDQATVVTLSPRDASRTSEFLSSCHYLGVRPVVIEPDANADPLGRHPIDSSLLDQLEQVMNDASPATVLVPSAHATHQDHRWLASISQALLRPGDSRRSGPRIVAAYEHPGDVGFRPTLFVPVPEHAVAAKIATLRGHYPSQYLQHPSTRSLEAMTALARLRGAQCGHDCAEAFELIRGIS